MPKLVNIPADADPAPEPPTVAELEAAVKAAADQVEELRAKRVAARALAPSEKAKILAATDDPFVEALAALNQAERQLGRARGAAAGRRVGVGAAGEKTAAGKGRR